MSSNKKQEKITAQNKSAILADLRKKEHPTKAEKINKDKEIEKELKNIYRDKKGTMPNLTKLDFIPRNRTRNIIILLIAGLFIIFTISLLGFFVFKPEPKFSGDKVNVEIKAPFTAISGDNVNYQIKLSNSEQVSLTQIILTVYLPVGFIFKDSNFPPLVATTEEQSNIKTWQFNDLFINASEIVNINGILVGPINSRQTLSATLSYVPANFSSEFQKSGSMLTEITGSLLDFSLEHGVQIANAETTEIKAKIINNSEETEISNLEFDFNFPPEFILFDSQILTPEQTPSALPKIDKNFKSAASPNILTSDKLLPREEKTLLFRGKFEVSESKSLELNLQAKLKGPADEYITQKEEKFSVEIIKGDLLTNLIIQGSNQNKPINFGDTLNYLLSLENKSKKALGDIKVRAVLDSPCLNWQTLSDKNNGVQEENQILWTKDKIPDLALLLPEEEIQISFQIELKDLADIKKYKPEELAVKSFFETQINQIDNNEAEILSQSNTVINELNTNLSLAVDGRYFGNNSETLGSGPLPPIVGQKTTYKIFWTLTNSLHEIVDIEVKAKLPDYLVFEDKQNLSTGNLYKNQSNEIVWQISRIPVSINQATAQFEISLTPKPADVSKILTLLQESLIKATDSQTKGQITFSVPGITTNLDSDPLGKNKGLIQSE